MTSPKEQRGALSHMDHELEKRLRMMMPLLLARTPGLDPRDLIWMIGALLQQRVRICTVLRQAHDDMARADIGEPELLDLMRNYAEIRTI